MKCRAIIPPANTGCGAEITHRVKFKDGDKVFVRQPCALRFQQIAMSHGTTVEIKPMSELEHERPR